MNNLPSLVAAATSSTAAIDTSTAAICCCCCCCLLHLAICCCCCCLPSAAAGCFCSAGLTRMSLGAKFPAVGMPADPTIASVLTLRLRYSICTVGTATLYSFSLSDSCSKKSCPGRSPTDSSLRWRRRQRQQRRGSGGSSARRCNGLFCGQQPGHQPLARAAAAAAAFVLERGSLAECCNNGGCCCLFRCH